jgi:uncharacterized membrane protein YphA (DoxX/SURF4 family)
MKRTNILYWVFTGLFGVFMVSTAIPNILLDAGSIDLISTQLGYPQYMIPFLGVAKTLGGIMLFIPGFPRLKEWAYAGLFFDLIGATYSAIAVEGFQLPHLFMGLFIGMGALSYVFYHKRLKEQSASTVA